ncbi:probable histone acetyltransferase HAC-like 3 isoform X3 [Salvia miltiorrhiza]|uniref:probable histone acetyltransferase HAC-like 3 isoform X3 n=1 Tax=Salvia miltiorrhiza TaxID=226208 RepID=UPI0025AC8C48|nr:probable histone acetyltransferase HAC-like 3 isoform X3 [Salvia miltiorrhiza]
MNLDWKKQRSDGVAVMNSRLFEGSAKECLNREIACQYQNLMYHQTNDNPAFLGASSSHESFLPICRPSAGFGFPLGSYDPNLPYFASNYSMTSNSGSSMLRLDDKYNPRHFQKFSQDDHRGFTRLVDSDCKDCYSDETPFKVGALGAFSDPTSGDNMALDQFISLWIQEDTSALPSMPLSKSKLRHEHLPSYGLQAPTSEHCRPPSCPPAHVEISLGTQMYGYGIQHQKLHHKVPVEKSSKLSQLSSKRFLSAEQKGFSNVQAPRPTYSISYLQDILIAYLSFKCKLEGLERRQEFVNHLHYTVCTATQICECVDYRTLISHFHDCRNTNCNLCQPVRQWCHSKKISAGPIYESHPMKKVTSESGKSNLYVSRDLRARDYNLPDVQPKPKRMKIENAAKFDNWSLHAVILPHIEQREGGLVDVEDYMDKANKEPLSSKEASATAVTWNETAGDGGSMWSRISNGLLGVGQLPEGHIVSASMNEVPRSIGNFGNSLQTFNDALNLDNIKLGKDDAISHSEWHRLVVEQLDMGYIKTRKEESVTFGSQSTHSDGIDVLPPIGKIPQTSSDALDHDSIKLGKDVAISHSEEQNMVDEQQEIVCVKTSKVKTDVTYGCQDINSPNISVFPQVLDSGRSLRTFNDGHDLDSTNLGKDYAISHSEENNLLDEQQEIGCVTISKVKSNVTFSSQSLNANGISVLPQDSPIDEGENAELMSQAEHERIDARYVLAKPDYQCGRKLDNLKPSGVSLTDFFTAEQIREHLCSLNQDINLTVGQDLHASMSAQTLGSNTCQLCALDTLTFSALAMCCTSCGARIKHKLTYYWTKDGTGERYCFCTVCFKEARGGNISYRGLSFPKAQLYKDKNTEESGEAWVQCDRCERWQHQICALYNSERDLKGKAKYICPFCQLAEIEAKGHVPITPVTGAQELPRTKLSDYIEQRLFGSLQRERKQRAEFLGKNPEEVPGASDLTVRVVLSVNKKLRVKQQFLDILHGETYPSEFPYKSKVILLFQKVEAVDVCIFAMFVQEFGSECGNPNKRSVYISYLDSVKYFRPEIKTVAGVALRTFVYHEILIGYLDYCKRLGFVTCYIWACPPLKGEDYILHCHPETQKRPNSHKLVQWYKKMLKKGKEENVVVEFTNFYDHFFVPSGDSNCKITAARLPYFDGDYWSRAIEDMVQTIEKDGGESDRQLKNQMTKRTMKAMGHNDLSADATKDILVMQKLGLKMLTAKEEFLVVHLQFTCTNCHEAILSGSFWSCNHCSKFYLCSRCLEQEQYSNLLETHTETFGVKHHLDKIPVNEVAADTDDNDGLLDNDLFDDRQSFLNFCEKNFYRFDSLRRAKHSSMMIIYHFLASRSRPMEAICSICNLNVVAGWYCEICPQFDVCDACFQREGDHCHFHKLVKHLTKADSRKMSEHMQQQVTTGANSREKSKQIQQYSLPEILDTLKHANQCLSTKDNPCLNPKCRLIKNAFRHTKGCKRRAVGGCNSCKRTWDMIQKHSHACKDSNCHIPRCMDIRNYKRSQKMMLSKEVV